MQTQKIRQQSDTVKGDLLLFLCYSAGLVVDAHIKHELYSWLCMKSLRVDIPDTVISFTEVCEPHLPHLPGPPVSHTQL